MEVPLKCYTDSRTLFDNIVGINAPTARRLLIYLSTFRQSYERREVSEVVWIPREQTPADSRTKIDS